MLSPVIKVWFRLGSFGGWDAAATRPYVAVSIIDCPSRSSAYLSHDRRVGTIISRQLDRVVNCSRLIPGSGRDVGCNICHYYRLSGVEAGTYTTSNVVLLWGMHIVPRPPPPSKQHNCKPVCTFWKGPVITVLMGSHLLRTVAGQTPLAHFIVSWWSKP